MTQKTDEVKVEHEVALKLDDVMYGRLVMYTRLVSANTGRVWRIPEAAHGILVRGLTRGLKTKFQSEKPSRPNWFVRLLHSIWRRMHPVSVRTALYEPPVERRPTRQTPISLTNRSAGQVARRGERYL